MTSKRKTKAATNPDDITYRIKFTDPQKEAAKQQQIKAQLDDNAKNLQNPTRTILVKNVPESHMDRYDFRSTFAVFGEVEQYATFVEKNSGETKNTAGSTNFGAVRYQNVSSAIAAVRALNGKTIEGMTIGAKNRSSTLPLVMSYVEQGKAFPTASASASTSSSSSSSSSRPSSAAKQQPQPSQQSSTTTSTTSNTTKNENTKNESHTTTSSSTLKVNKQMSQTLIQMGFNKQQAEAALLATSNSSVEDAVDYIQSNFPTPPPTATTTTAKNDENTQNEQLSKEEKKRLKKERQKLQKSSSSQPQKQATKKVEKLDEKIEKIEKIEENNEQTQQQDELEQKEKVLQLIEKMKFQVSNDDFVAFRKTSADFQKGVIGAKEYYKAFYRYFSRDEEAIFFLLLETMPNRSVHTIEQLILARHEFHSSQRNRVQNQENVLKNSNVKSVGGGGEAVKETSASEQQQQKKKKKKKNNVNQGEKEKKQQQQQQQQQQVRASAAAAAVVNKNNPFASLAGWQ